MASSRRWGSSPSTVSKGLSVVVAGESTVCSACSASATRPSWSRRRSAVVSSTRHEMLDVGGRGHGWSRTGVGSNAPSRRHQRRSSSRMPRQRRQRDSQRRRQKPGRCTAGGTGAGIRASRAARVASPLSRSTASPQRSANRSAVRATASSIGRSDPLAQCCRDVRVVRSIPSGAAGGPADIASGGNRMPRAWA